MILRLFSPRKISKLKLTNSFAEIFSELRTGMHSYNQLTDESEKEKLEKSFRNTFDFDGDAIIFPHARVAIHYILKSYAFEKGSEVLMTPLTISDMVNSIHSAGYYPKMVDIELHTLNFDLAALEKAITPKTKAILITYITGVVPNLDKIMDLANKHNLKIIEDCSQAVFSRYNGKLLGSFGDAAVFSMTNFKIIAALFGGMILTKNQTLVSQLREFYKRDFGPPDLQILRNHCRKNFIYLILFQRFIFSYSTYFLILLLEYCAPSLIYRLYSGNIKVILGDYKNTLWEKLPARYLTKFTAAQARLGHATLERAKNIAKIRHEHGKTLLQKILPHRDLFVPHELAGAENAYWRLPILTPHVDQLKKTLLLNGIDCAKPFLTLCSTEPGFEPYHQNTPQAQFFKKNALILEIHESMNHSDIEVVANVVNNFFRARGEK